MSRQGDLKHKIRQLKRLERRLRGDRAESLIWNEFFDLSDEGAGRARYSLAQLLTLDRDSLKAVLEEYLGFIFYAMSEEAGNSGSMFDPAVLLEAGLPVDADKRMVKERFRELVKIHHPDSGGDPQAFVEILRLFDELR